MNSRIRQITLLQLPIVTSAVWALIRLSGLPGKLHLTPARLLIAALIIAGLSAWILLCRKFISEKLPKPLSAICFQIAAVSIAGALFFYFIGRKYSAADGFLYSAAAFMRQANPFWVFTADLRHSSPLTQT